MNVEILIHAKTNTSDYEGYTGLIELTSEHGGYIGVDAHSGQITNGENNEVYIRVGSLESVGEVDATYETLSRAVALTDITFTSHVGEVVKVLEATVHITDDEETKLDCSQTTVFNEY